MFCHGFVRLSEAMYSVSSVFMDRELSASLNPISKMRNEIRSVSLPHAALGQMASY